MGYRLMDWVYEQPIKDAGEKFVLLTIAKHCDEANQSYPSVSRISKLTGLAMSTVSLKIKALETSGYLSIYRRTKNGIKTTSIYTVKSPHDTRQSDKNKSDITNNKYNIYLSSITDSRLSEEDQLAALAKLAMQGE